MSDWYHDHVLYTGRSAALWLLIGFVVTYAITRSITVKIRKRNLSGEGDEGATIKDVVVGGVHIHHQVWGILTLMITGLLEFRFRPDHPWVEVLAALFGAGAALALDEFALWLHLEDVYWSEEGKKSIDAVMIAAVVGLFMLMGSSPIGVTEEGTGTTAPIVLAFIVVVHIAYTIVCLLKGKLALGLIGLPLPTVSLLGAIRLAKPNSYWAKRHYGPEKMAKSEARFGAEYQARWERIRDIVS
jgi:hypothetical protein